jgi:hypothetical protein
MPPVFSKKKAAAILATVLLLDDLEEERIKKKRKWCKNWFLKRNLYSHMKLLRQLHENEPHDLKNYLRMDNDTYRSLLKLVRNKISKQTTNMTNSISAEERLTATLRYLATGNSYEDLRFNTGISPQSIDKVIPEFCPAIFSKGL